MDDIHTFSELMLLHQDATSAWVDSDQDPQRWLAIVEIEQLIVERLGVLPNPPYRISYEGRVFKVNYGRKSLDFLYAIDVAVLDLKLLVADHNEF